MDYYKYNSDKYNNESFEEIFNKIKCHNPFLTIDEEQLDKNIKQAKRNIAIRYMNNKKRK